MARSSYRPKALVADKKRRAAWMRGRVTRINHARIEREEGVMGEIGVPELLIILAIVLLIFGPGRIVGVASGLGHAISSFRRSAREDNEPPKPEDMAHSNQ